MVQTRARRRALARVTRRPGEKEVLLECGPSSRKEYRAQLVIKDLFEHTCALDHSQIKKELESHHRGSLLWTCLMAELVLRCMHSSMQAFTSAHEAEMYKRVRRFSGLSDWALCLVGCFVSRGLGCEKDEDGGVALVNEAMSRGYWRARFFKEAAVDRYFKMKHFAWDTDSVRLLWDDYTHRSGEKCERGCTRRRCYRCREKYEEYWAKRLWFPRDLTKEVVNQRARSLTQRDVSVAQLRIQFGDYRLRNLFCRGMPYFMLAVYSKHPDERVDALVRAFCGDMRSFLRLAWKYRDGMVFRDGTALIEQVMKNTANKYLYDSFNEGEAEYALDNALIMYYVGQCLWTGYCCKKVRRATKEHPERHAMAAFARAASLEAEFQHDFSYWARCFRHIQYTVAFFGGHSLDYVMVTRILENLFDLRPSTN